MHGAFALCGLVSRDSHYDGLFRTARCLERAACGYCPLLCGRPCYFRVGNRAEIGNVLACLGRW
jgi:hypothetical protein